jgi:hypothetical protein
MVQCPVSRLRVGYGGYAGYFQEPNVHIWEGVWNPDSLAIDSPG